MLSCWIIFSDRMLGHVNHSASYINQSIKAKITHLLPRNVPFGAHPRHSRPGLDGCAHRSVLQRSMHSQSDLHSPADVTMIITCSAVRAATVALCSIRFLA
jgi:hypothetical protein